MLQTVMIVFIAPYEKLKDIADTLAPSYDIPIQTIVGNLGEGLTAAKAALGQDAIVVSRGGTTKLIQETLGIEVIEIGLSHLDLITILKPFIGSSRKLAVVGFHSLTDHAEKLCQVLDLPALFLPIDNESEIDSRMKELVALKIDCVIGDMISTKAAQNAGIDFCLIESGPEAVKEALDKAAIVARSLHARRENETRLTAILNTVKEGILSLNKYGKIDLLNRTASKLLGLNAVIGTSAENALPGAEIQNYMKNRKQVTGKLIMLEGREIALTLTPIIVGPDVEGAVAVVQDVGRIQAIEKQLRRQQHAKGLVAKYDFSDVYAGTGTMRSCLGIARQYARTSSSILLYGETGTGKELLAQSIHNESPVHDGPFVAINCGALPPSLLESELFGYAEGAFTGAVKGGKAGLFELAHGGSIFLDEINELDIQLQGKLLRVLQEREVMRVGDLKVIPVSVRVIAASNIPLKDEIHNGRFREDVYYRLSVLDIRIPPLRERREDILPLFKRFTQTYSQRNGAPSPEPIPGHLVEALMAYEWPGNVRELENTAKKWNVLRGIFSVGEAAGLVLSSLFQDWTPQEQQAGSGVADLDTSGTLEEMEQQLVRKVLLEESGNISRAARRLGIDRQTLRRKTGE
ncbi:MAG: sigma 54-interacting transcriptional regulator [Spirochaetota bacterium]